MIHENQSTLKKKKEAKNNKKISYGCRSRSNSATFCENEEEYNKRLGDILGFCPDEIEKGGRG